MKLSLRWLARHLDYPNDTAAVAQALTAMGIEVAAVEPAGAGLEAVELVRIVERRPLAGSDHLGVVTVERGDGTTLEVVSGAANAEAGRRVWYAPAGTVLPGGRRLEEARFFGHPSPGMLCSAQELGLSAPGDLWWWPDAATPLGTRLWQALGPDTVLDLELTPNLAAFDQSVRGLARELAAYWNRPLKPLPWQPAAPTVGPEGRLRLEAPELCPLYGLAEVSCTSGGFAPLWMQSLLLAVGQRPINGVVDLTNFLLFDLGQPLHAFDADRLRPPLTVRRARAGERLTTLDGQERELTAADLVIADAAGPVALAGVMGGAASAVGPATRRLWVESAHFAAPAVFSTMRRHNLPTEAAERFGRGSDPALVPVALAAFCALLPEVVDGPTQVQAVMLAGAMPPRREIALGADGFAPVRRLLGLPLDDGAVAEALSRLGFEVEADRVRVPSWRPDVGGMADLAEEVARLRGLDEIPARLPERAASTGTPDPVAVQADRVRDLLAAAGCQEVLTPIFCAAQSLATVGWWAASQERPLTLVNPLREAEGHLRRNLLAGLSDVLLFNLHYGVELRPVFEVAPVYAVDAGGAVQEPWHGAVLAPAAAGRGWLPEREATVFDLKGLILALAERLGWNLAVDASQPAPPPFHPGRSAWLVDGAGRRVGVLGEWRAGDRRLAHQRLLAMEWRLPDPVGERWPSVEKPSRFPPVERDLSVVPWPQATYAEVAAVIGQAAGRWAETVRLLDRYPAEEGTSLTFRLRFRRPDGTLSDDEVETVMETVTAALVARGARLRGR